MVQVVAEGEVPAETKPEPAPAAVQEPTVHPGAQSPLALLRGKREELKAKLFLDLKVPRWEVAGRQVWVRYGPGSPSVLTASAERRQAAHKPGMPDWKVRANADVLVDACVAIYDLPIGEEPPKGDLPVLDVPYPVFTSEEVQEAMGVQRNAAETVCSVYLTEGDLLLAANTLLDWSGIVSEKVEQDFLGS
jgi:hypothetical protein